MFTFVLSSTPTTFNGLLYAVFRFVIYQDRMVSTFQTQLEAYAKKTSKGLLKHVQGIWSKRLKMDEFKYLLVLQILLNCTTITTY